MYIISEKENIRRTRQKNNPSLHTFLKVQWKTLPRTPLSTKLCATFIHISLTSPRTPSSHNTASCHLLERSSSPGYLSFSFFSIINTAWRPFIHTYPPLPTSHTCLSSHTPYSLSPDNLRYLFISLVPPVSFSLSTRTPSVPFLYLSTA